MKFILTKVPIVEDVLTEAFSAYLKELRWPEFQPNFRSVNISNDHPFEELLGNADSGSGARPNLFPSVTIVSNTDGEVPGMGKKWQIATLSNGDLDTFDGLPWYVSDGALADLKTALTQHGNVYGLQHSTMWRDSASIEIWTENIQIKNDLYNLALAFLTGPKVMQLKQDSGITIFSANVNGQRSGYYNFDFGRVLYGGRITFTADYQVLQAVYDSDIGSIAKIQHSYREVLNG